MKTEIELLIAEYLKEVEKVIAVFSTKIGRKDILRAWGEKAIPAKGKISKDVFYELHGIGCYLSYKDYHIDFDFGPNDRIDGFDLYKLKDYAQQFPDKYPQYQDRDILEKDFNRLIELGIISQKYIGNSWLFFLIKN